MLLSICRLIEDHSLLPLSEEAVEDLTRTYQNLVTNPRNRRILRSRDAPEEEELVRIHSLFDPNDEYVFNISIDRKTVIKQNTEMKTRLNRSRNKLTSSDINDGEDLRLSLTECESPDSLKKSFDSNLNQNKKTVLSNSSVNVEISPQSQPVMTSVKPKRSTTNTSVDPKPSLCPLNWVLCLNWPTMSLPIRPRHYQRGRD